jgi:hypothetical protein
MRADAGYMPGEFTVMFSAFRDVKDLTQNRQIDFGGPLSVVQLQGLPRKHVLQPIHKCGSDS